MRHCPSFPLKSSCFSALWLVSPRLDGGWVAAVPRLSLWLGLRAAWSLSWVIVGLHLAMATVSGPKPDPQQLLAAGATASTSLATTLGSQLSLSEEQLALAVPCHRFFLKKDPGQCHDSGLVGAS